MKSRAGWWKKTVRHLMQDSKAAGVCEQIEKTLARRALAHHAAGEAMVKKKSAIEFLQMHTAGVDIYHHRELGHISVVEAIAGDALTTRPLRQMASILCKAIGESGNGSHAGL